MENKKDLEKEQLSKVSGGKEEESHPDVKQGGAIYSPVVGPDSGNKDNNKHDVH